MGIPSIAWDPHSPAQTTTSQPIKGKASHTKLTLDDFTKSLLTNDEALDINQDSLGKQVVRVGGAGKPDVTFKYRDPHLTGAQ